MASKFYGKHLPDYGDLDNITGTAPGYRVYILENDGGICLQMLHADEDPVTGVGAAVFLNTEEARELMGSLLQAIERAEPKEARHPARGIAC